MDGPPPPAHSPVAGAAGPTAPTLRAVRISGSPPEPLVERVLAARGMTEPVALADFLDPSLRAGLHDPSLLPGVDAAAERILAALRAAEPLAIYGDYDVDGVTATAILHHTILAIEPAANLTRYIPHRLDEGYGLNTAAIEELAARGCKVIVTVDCGVTAVEPAAAAKRLGVDLIITDHHNPASDGSTPDAFALVHPRAPGSRYPFAELSGAGVAFKLAWRLATMHRGDARVSDDTRSVLLECLALACLGAIADVVPLVGENRVIARFGLVPIAESARKPTRCLRGLGALVRAAGLDGSKVAAEDVGFRLGPMLNAAGRMGHAATALELLTTADGPRATELAAELSRFNSWRRRVELQIFEHARVMAAEAGMTTDDRRAVVLAHEDWHAGVIGIVCSRLVERFGRPTILMQRSADSGGQVCKGSGRSIDGFSLHGALASCGDLLHTFGGHEMAAGLTLRHDNLEAFTARFIEHANSRLAPDDLVPRLDFDCHAALHELTPLAVRQLDRLGPFGRGNPAVRVRLDDLTVGERPVAMGAGGKHLALRVRQGESWARLVGWSMGELAERLPTGTRISAVVTPAISTWNGSVRVEPVLRDVAFV